MKLIAVLWISLLSCGNGEEEELPTTTATTPALPLVAKILSRHPLNNRQYGVSSALLLSDRFLLTVAHSVAHMIAESGDEGFPRLNPHYRIVGPVAWAFFGSPAEPNLVDGIFVRAGFLTTAGVNASTSDLALVRLRDRLPIDDQMRTARLSRHIPRLHAKANIPHLLGYERSQDDTEYTLKITVLGAKSAEKRKEYYPVLKGSTNISKEPISELRSHGCQILTRIPVDPLEDEDKVFLCGEVEKPMLAGAALVANNPDGDLMAFGLYPGEYLPNVQNEEIFIPLAPHCDWIDRVTNGEVVCEGETPQRLDGEAPAP